jgi:septum formation protein
MRDFSDSFLEAYLARNAAALASSLGGFQLEGEGAQLFESIDGDFFTVLGLPLMPLLAQLRLAGSIAP